MKPVRPEPNLTYLRETPPPIQVGEGNVNINFSLTLPEVAYLGFMEANNVRSTLDQEIDLIFLESNERTQRIFRDWTAVAFNGAGFTPEELKLDGLMTSVWWKSKVYVEADAILYEQNEEMSKVKKLVDQATLLSLYLNLTGREGKVFSKGQIRLFVKSIESIAKSSVRAQGS